MKSAVIMTRPRIFACLLCKCGQKSFEREIRLFFPMENLSEPDNEPDKNGDALRRQIYRQKISAACASLRILPRGF
jgi:hypothetical protein